MSEKKENEKHMRAKQGKLRVVIKVKWLSYFLPYCKKKGFFFLEESQLIRETSDSKMMEARKSVEMPTT